MNNRKRNNGILFILFIFIVTLGMASCEDYLDKAPSSDISDKDVYGNFISFQGFMEEMYNCIADPHKALAGNIYYNAFFDDATLTNSPLMWDDGNYWDQQWRFLTGSVNTGIDSSNGTMAKRIWPLAWYAIRKSNIALSNLHLLEVATEDERNIIEGQAYFFRGFFHLELMQYYGGLPYIDTLLVASQEMKIPRLSYKETALKVAADLQKAADLLPIDWDNTTAGQRTKGNNRQRASKIEALGYLGKNLLYAASPMMNESSTGVNAYDAELCKQAAGVFAEVIRLSGESGAYALEPWETRSSNFWVDSPGNKTRPGGKEVIRNQTIYNLDYSRWTTNRTSNPVQFGAGNTRVEVPTHNYVENYGMANGLPLNDPASGYNPNDPFSNRDPRFYVDIVVDGNRIANSTGAGVHQFAQLYNGGIHKGGTQGSVTGYYYRKFTPLGCNQWDNRWGNFQTYQPRLRLADIYLMYAEAVLWGYGSAKSSAPGSSLTSEQAFNTIRNRSNLPDIDQRFLASKESFMEEIIRERAVELAFEGLRWFDLRRWNVLGEMKYREKYALDYDRGSDGKPINIQKRLVFTRPIEKKHNWVPFEVNDISIYAEFPQNPGW
jgi:SusD family.